jgi:hypothetical protein
MRLVVSFLLLLAGCSAGKLTFEARVADLRKPGNHFLIGKEPEDSVRVTASGKMLDTAAVVEKVNRAQADWSTPEHSVASVISANTAGDLPWIVQNYVPAERPEAGRQLIDPMAAARTRAYYLNLGSVKLIGWADIDGKRIMFLRGDDADGDSSIATVVLAKTGEGWRQTIELNRDDRYDVVIAALHHSGVH